MIEERVSLSDIWVDGQDSQVQGLYINDSASL